MYKSKIALTIAVAGAFALSACSPGDAPGGAAGSVEVKSQTEASRIAIKMVSEQIIKKTGKDATRWLSCPIGQDKVIVGKNPEGQAQVLFKIGQESVTVSKADAPSKGGYCVDIEQAMIDGIKNSK